MLLQVNTVFTFAAGILKVRKLFPLAGRIKLFMFFT